MDQCDVFHLTALCITIASVCIFSEKKTAIQISGLAFCAISVSLDLTSRDVPPAGIIVWPIYFAFGALLAWLLFGVKTFFLSKMNKENSDKTKITTNKVALIAVLKGLGIVILFVIIIGLLVGLFFPSVGFPTEKNKGNVFGILLVALCMIIGTVEEHRFYRKNFKNQNALSHSENCLHDNTLG